MHTNILKLVSHTVTFYRHAYHVLTQGAGTIKRKKVKVKVTLEQAMKAQRGSRALLYSFFNLGSRSGWVVNVTLRPL